MNIIIDAMGGDNAPLEIVKGALSAHARFGCDITLTGDETAIREALAQCGVQELPQGMDIVPTSCPPALPFIPPPRRWTCATIPPPCSAGRRTPPWARR